MKYRVALTARAQQDRNAIFDWYAEHYSLDFADRWYEGLHSALGSLVANPTRCGLAHENDKFPFELRELLYGGRVNKHRILFTIHEDLVLVLHLRHSSRRDLREDDLGT
jgi:plasmid stabilization system protein ParE